MSRKKGRLVLGIFIDALGWEIQKKRGFLDDILVLKRPLGTILGYSATCIPTILTGRLPRDHGHLSFFLYSPETSPFRSYRALGYLPRFLTRRGRVRGWLSRFIRWRLGYTGYFQIYNVPFEYLPFFDYSEKKDLYRRGGINSGAPTLFDYLTDREIPHHVSNWRASEETNIASLESALREGEVEFAYLYLASMDALLHAEGTESSRVDDKLAWYDGQIRRIVGIARQNYDELRLFVFSDHGMTDVRETCDLMSGIDELPYRFGRDYAAMYDSTMARFWFFDDRAREAIVEVLKGEERGEILSHAALREYGCDFPDPKFGEVFFLLKPGVLLCPSFMGEKPVAGMHGFWPEDKDSLAMFASNVDLETVPRRLDDLYALLTREATR
jgi:hypothetical protein